MLTKTITATFIVAALVAPTAFAQAPSGDQTPAQSRQQFDKKVGDPHIQDVKISDLVGDQVVGPMGMIGSVVQVIRDADNKPFFIVQGESQTVSVPVEITYLDGMQIMIEEWPDDGLTEWSATADKAANIETLAANDTVAMEQKQSS